MVAYGDEDAEAEGGPVSGLGVGLAVAQGFLAAVLLDFPLAVVMDEGGLLEVHGQVLGVP